MLRCLAALLLALGLATGAHSEEAMPLPLVAVLGTCTALTANTYPVDSVNWFDAARHSQVVFFAHLLFPQELPDTASQVAWHPPLVWKVPAISFSIKDDHQATAEWLDPAGQRIAYYSLTFPARIRSDWLDLGGKLYIPHTLAMAIGTRDLRSEAGQTRLPAVEGQYTVHLSVDGRPTALAFFRMLRTRAAVSAQSVVDSPSAPKPLSAPVQAR